MYISGFKVIYYCEMRAQIVVFSGYNVFISHHPFSCKASRLAMLADLCLEGIIRFIFCPIGCGARRRRAKIEGVDISNTLQVIQTRLQNER